MFLSVTEILHCSALYNYVLTFAIKIQWLHNPLFYDTKIYYLRIFRSFCAAGFSSDPYQFPVTANQAGWPHRNIISLH